MLLLCIAEIWLVGEGVAMPRYCIAQNIDDIKLRQISRFYILVMKPLANTPIWNISDDKTLVNSRKLNSHTSLFFANVIMINPHCS